MLFGFLALAVVAVNVVVLLAFYMSTSQISLSIIGPSPKTNHVFPILAKNFFVPLPLQTNSFHPTLERQKQKQKKKAEVLPLDFFPVADNPTLEKL